MTKKDEAKVAKEEVKNGEADSKTSQTAENPKENVREQNEKPELNTRDSADNSSSKEKANLSEKIAELEEKCKDWQNQYLRKAADFENYRKRMLKEKQDAIDYANTNLLLDLVQVLDDFDRAIDASASQTGEKEKSSFAEGVIMIKNQMVSMLSSKYGLLHYPTKGESFDPNLHEAVSMLPSKDVTEQVVGEELQKGYKLKERVIRHSKVMVLMPEQKKAENSENKKDNFANAENTKKNDKKTAKTEETAGKNNK